MNDHEALRRVITRNKWLRYMRIAALLAVGAGLSMMSKSWWEAIIDERCRAVLAKERE
jgi:predicted nucleic acid-binding Zn ribbon protein